MVADSVFHDPSWFPDRLDFQNKLLRLVPVERATMLRSAFLDGRTPLTTNPNAARVVPLRSFLAALTEAPSFARWVLHESFCGSTLLARALTVPDQVSCLREPQILLDLSTWRQALAGAEDRALYQAAVRATVAKLSQRWPDGAPIVIKPSNWANTIAADLLAAARDTRAIVVQNTPQAFLIAVLRGGRDRLRYVLQLRAHLAAARPDLAALAADTPGAAAGTLEEALALSVQCFWMQRMMLRDVVGSSGTQHNMLSLRFPDWLSAPLDNVVRAQHALGLSIPADATARAVACATLHYSKDNDNALFDKDAEDVANARILTLYAHQIEAALTLYDRHMSDTRAVDQRQIDAA